MSKLLMFPSRQVPCVVKEMRACEEVEQDEDGRWIIDDLHRQYTLLLLRRYFRMSIDMGRLPSVLGRNEFFRARVSSYKVHTFEDAVIFVHDMERSLEKLDEMSRRMIAGIVFLEYSRAEVAEALGIYRTTVANHYNDALDSLGRILLDSKMINPAELRRAKRHRVNTSARLREIPMKKPCDSEGCETANTPEHDESAVLKRR
jgi:hypothetical protein